MRSAKSNSTQSGMQTAKSYRRFHRNKTATMICKVLLILCGIIAIFIMLGQSLGWISNANAGDNWPSNYANYGWFALIGAILFAMAILLVLFHLNRIACCLGTIGTALCIGMTILFARYAADNSFYSTVLSMQVKNLYIFEMIPFALAFVSLWLVGLLQFFSPKAREKRFEKKQEKTAIAPSILDD